MNGEPDATPNDSPAPVDHSQRTDYAWYGSNTNTVQPVTAKRANPWGLHGTDHRRPQLSTVFKWLD